jgi:hypothetical protein
MMYSRYALGIKGNGMKDRFTSLRIISRIVRGVAILLAASFLLFPCLFTLVGSGSLVTMSSGLTDLSKAATTRPTIEMILSSVIVITIPGLIAALILYAAGELILVLLAIEENTRTTAEMLRLRRKPNPENRQE